MWRLIKRSHGDICSVKCFSQRQLGESKVTQVLLLIITSVADEIHMHAPIMCSPNVKCMIKRQRAMSSIEFYIKPRDVATGKWSRVTSHALIGLKYSVTLEDAINCLTVTWGYFSQMRESTASEEAPTHLHIFSSLAGRVTISPRTVKEREALNEIFFLLNVFKWNHFDIDSYHFAFRSRWCFDVRNDEERERERQSFSPSFSLSFFISQSHFINHLVWLMKAHRREPFFLSSSLNVSLCQHIQLRLGECKSED